MSPERLAVVRAAVIEFCAFDRYLRSIEADIAAAWPHVDAHLPLAIVLTVVSVGTTWRIRQRAAVSRWNCRHSVLEFTGDMPYA